MIIRGLLIPGVGVTAVPHYKWKPLSAERNPSDKRLQRLDLPNNKSDDPPFSQLSNIAMGISECLRNI